MGTFYLHKKWVALRRLQTHLNRFILEYFQVPDMWNLIVSYREWSSDQSRGG